MDRPAVPPGFAREQGAEERATKLEKEHEAKK